MNIWTRLGISVAFLGLFCILCSEMIERDGFYDSNRQHIAAGMSASGITLFFVGRFLNRKRALRNRPLQVQPETQSEDNREESSQPFLFANLAFWGPMLLAFSLVVLFIPAKARPAAPVAARAPLPPKKQETPAPPTNVAPPRLVVKTNSVIFPPMKLQGTTQRGERSSAIINGQTYFLGENVGPAKLISIFESSIVLEMNGEFKTVKLGQ